MIKIEWLSFKKGTPPKGYWDMAFIEDVLASLEQYESDRVVCIIPGAYQYDKYKEINRYISEYSKVLVIITSDEESKFDTTQLSHPDMVIYSTYANKGKNRNVDFWLPLGYTPHTRNTLKNLGLPKKDLNWFFSGQVTHDSRRQLVEKLKETDIVGELIETHGFSQGLEKEDYIACMWRAKIVPSPAGAVSADAFRTYEALESAAIPLPEDPSYYSMLFDNLPFAVEKDWSILPSYINDYVGRYPQLNNEVFAWWQLQKRNIRERFKQDLGIKEDLTVIIPTSPIKRHPDMSILEETIENVRKQLPDTEIIITFDGVRKEQKSLDDRYQEYIRRVLWKTNFEWKNVTPIVFREHKHQVGMARETIKIVNTPVILYVEHDAPIVPDRDIEWDKLIDIVKGSEANMIRFHFEEAVHPEHEYLTLDKIPKEVGGVKLIRTAQWSQRPHLANTAFYRRMLYKHFTPQANSMIEDKMHGVLAGAYLQKGKAGWNDFRVWMYAPDGGYKRSYHTDGRDSAKKYDDKQVF